MKVLVLGARGMLGQAIMNTWPEHDLVGLDLPEIDITKPHDVGHALTTYRPELVINCAAYTAVDACETNEDVANKANGLAVEYMAKACDAQRVPLVHISTDYVFDGTKESGYREDDVPTEPVNAYGRTKLHGERSLLKHASRHYLIRTSWLYGPGGKNFVQTMLDLAASKKELSVVNDQHGKPTMTHDLSLFIKALVTDHAPYGIYHGVNEEATTWFDFAQEIFRLSGNDVVVQPTTTDAFPRPAQRPHWSILVNTKRPPLRAWTEALRDYLGLIGYAG